MPKSDTLASKLGEAQPIQHPRAGYCKVEAVFVDRPDVLESIKRARVERGLSYAHIASILSEEGTYISASAVRGWLRSEGIS